MIDLLFSTAFTLWAAPTSWAEAIAFVLALAMVGCNMREVHWGWPLAFASSVLYFGVFWRSRLYGDASLQLFFALLALWGWAQWLRGRASDGSALHITRLSARGWWAVAVAAAVLWPAIGLFLMRYTDTDVPWWDAFPTALSLVGQLLLGRKLLENWTLWIVVNTVGTALFAWKGLWLTVLLYGIFTVLSVAGWRAWRQRIAAA
jgi:nicotinamide mononucleotide transporter